MWAVIQAKVEDLQVLEILSLADYSNGCYSLDCSSTTPTEGKHLQPCDVGVYAVDVDSTYIYGVGSSGLYIWDLTSSLPSTGDGLGDVPGFFLLGVIIALFLFLLIIKGPKLLNRTDTN